MGVYNSNYCRLCIHPITVIGCMQSESTIDITHHIGMLTLSKFKLTRSQNKVMEKIHISHQVVRRHIQSKLLFHLPGVIIYITF